MILEENKIAEIISEVRYNSRLNKYSGNIVSANEMVESNDGYYLRLTLNFNIPYYNFRMRIRNINI